MKTFGERLKELKEDLEPKLEARMIFLLNPKDTKSLETIVAWGAMDHSEVDGSLQVPDDADMEYLWSCFEPDIMKLAEVLNVDLIETQSRYVQMRRLGIIYPDGSIAALAHTLVGMYIRVQAKAMEDKLRKKSKDGDEG
ncbi:MAG: hypothetical protein J6Y62_00580 [Clostridia bacterium]|nr:hypothetical protein [Clostridia bacterium]